MNLRSLDLDLLVVFDAIYQARNVTRAAEKIFLSQPATSNAAMRLRRHLNNELFLRGPDGLRPTPRAMELAPRLHGILTAPTLLLKRLKTAGHIMAPCPVAAPAEYRCIDLVWHGRSSRHPAQEWLREAITRAAQEAAVE